MRIHIDDHNKYITANDIFSQRNRSLMFDRGDNHEDIALSLDRCQIFHR